MQVITATFQDLLPPSTSLPPQLVPELIHRFSSTEGYSLYPDVLPLFKLIRGKSPSWLWEKTVVGIITNSDDRVPHILSSFGLRVGSRVFVEDLGSRPKPAFSNHEMEDINFVVMSYDVGFEKPHQRIFKAAESILHDYATMEDTESFEHLHVGDDMMKDVLGAQAAGWHALLLDRPGQYASKFANQIHLSERQIWEIEVGGTDLRKAFTTYSVQAIQDLRAITAWRPRLYCRSLPSYN